METTQFDNEQGQGNQANQQGEREQGLLQNGYVMQSNPCPETYPQDSFTD